jgi:PEP-CTERM motif
MKRMKRMKVMIGLAFVLLVFGIATNASADLIQNGSFESPVIETNGSFHGAPDNWTIDPVYQGYIFNNSAFAQDGDQYYDLGNTAAYFLSQTFVVTTAGTYELAWYASSTTENSAWVTSYSVSLSGASTTFNPGVLYNWQNQELSFNLTPSSYTLTFTSGPVVYGYDTLLDNVTLTSTTPPPVPTPEPATMLLLGLGLMGLARVRRKFKK